jgi:ppGpp synthetase/RelA/SpoT-type nucleotidyltranferase
MKKIARIHKIAWSIALRFAKVKDKFEITESDLVKNPNPKGVKEWVTQEYADQFLSKAKSPKSHGEKLKQNPPQPSDPEMRFTPPAGKERAEFNREQLKKRDPSSKNKHKFRGLSPEETKRAEELSKKKGSECTFDDIAEFIGFFEKSYEESKNWAKTFLKGGAKTYSGRWKDEQSLLEKMNGKFAHRTLETVGDVVANRCVCSSRADQAKLVDYIYENCVILEHDNIVDNPRGDGYSAHHFTLEAPDGRLIELQVKTENQQTFSGWSHDAIYKNKEVSENGKPKYPEVAKYALDLGNYINEIDSGKEPSTPPPQPPAILLKILKGQNKKPFDLKEIKRVGA